MPATAHIDINMPTTAHKNYDDSTHPHQDAAYALKISTVALNFIKVLMIQHVLIKMEIVLYSSCHIYISVVLFTFSLAKHTD